MTRTDASLAALLLTQRLVETPVPPLKASEYWALLEAVPDPSFLLGRDAAAVAQVAHVGVDEAERVVRLLDAATAVVLELDEQAQSGLQVITSLDEDYPSALVDRLERSAPPLLYAVGDPALLHTPLLGIVGARDVTGVGAEVGTLAARSAVGQGFGVISGGAKGVDQLAMNAALDVGGHVVEVLAGSLTQRTRDPEIRRAVADGRVCLCTPYKPTAGFSVASAMGRNKVIYALSTATFVVAADAERGGTWAGAIEAIKRRIAPVAVWQGDGQGAGNEQLVERGSAGVANLDDLFPLPQLARRVEGSASQLALNL